MATVTLVNHINEVAGGQLIERLITNSYASTTADTLNLPLKSPVNFDFRLLNTGTQTITIGAQTGETVTGNVSLLAGQIGTWLKTAATTWVGALTTTGEPA